MKSVKHREPFKERVSKRRDPSIGSGPGAVTNAGSSHLTGLESKKQGDGGISIPASWQRKTGKASSIFESFYHAFHGIKVGLSSQRNLRIHFTATPCVVVLGLVLQIDMASWLALVLVMAMVISTEFLNTALEHLVDIAAEGQYRYAARCAKDTAAAAVLTASVAAIATGLIVFLPRLLALIYS